MSALNTSTVRHANAIPARPALPALLHPGVSQLLGEHAEMVTGLVHGLGSPLHLLLPQVFDANVRRFRSALATAGVDGQVLFAKKANKARCFVQRCAALGIGVDAASAPELQQALGAGVRGDLISVSGPAKSSELLNLALRQGCWIAVDTPEELLHVKRLASQSSCVGRVLLRCRPDSQGQTHSRFGMTVAELDESLQLSHEHRVHVHLEGFSFHLAGYSALQRAALADQMIDRCLVARSMGLGCHTINIGGGFAVGYVEPSDWMRFEQTQSPRDFHAAKTFSGYYPYGSPVSGAAMLADILSAPVGGNATLADRLKQHGIRLLLEPGRALLDQAGVTAFRVQGVKDRHAEQEGYAILTVEGTSFSLSEQWFNSEYLPDPLLLGRSSGSDRAFDACVGGASCLDSDMLTWRKVPFPRRIEVGDILVYANTAGYQMDSNESPFHDLPLPRKVVMNQTGPVPHWRLDDVADAHATSEPLALKTN